jgi:redox-sensitive bicupin YhaK (pirin superfamily)
MIEPRARRRFARFLIRSDPMDYLFVDRITRPGGVPEGAHMLHDVRLEGEKRLELEVPAGSRAFLYVVSGRGRLEGDDTAIGQDDMACFERCRDRARIGIEADVPMRALLFADPPEN